MTALRRRQRTASRSGRLGGRGSLSQPRLDRRAVPARSPTAATLAALPTHKIGVTQVVTDGPEGDVTYHLQLGGGNAQFGAGPAIAEDVRMEQEWETAVRRRHRRAQRAGGVHQGPIRLTGDQQKLIDIQPVFGALDGVFASVREHTEYR